MTKPSKDAPPYLIASVDHALRLAVMLQTEGAMRVSDVAARLEVAPSTAHRLLSMLVYRDFARQRDDRRYEAGPALALPRGGDGLGQLRERALPLLTELVDHVEETVNLSILRGRHNVFVASVECAQPLRVTRREGTTFPAHLSSGGKALLAQLPWDRVEGLYAHDAGHGESWPSLPALRRELAGIRETGIAVNREETERGVVAIAVPLLGADGEAAAAISVSMPSVRYDEHRVRTVSRALRWTARDVSAALV